MMDAIQEPGIDTVVFMTSAQVGKSEILFNILGYHMDQDPCPLIMMQPTLQMCEAISKDRISPMIRDTPALTDLVNDPKSRDSGNTLLHKTFPGGRLTLVGANSPASAASRPARGILGDEIDRFPASAGTEGDPWKLLVKRTSTFHNRFQVLVSTPTVKGASRIEMAFEAGDQRRFHVPCPHCGAMQHLIWAGIKWEKLEDGSLKVWYQCQECEGAIEESEKTRMLKHGRWIARLPTRNIASFHINELYSPWRHWWEIVEDFLEAKKDPELLRVFVNTSLGETFEDGGAGLDDEQLYDQREDYGAEVADGVLAIVAGADVQDDRLEVSVVGFGIGEESWLVSHRILYGDPSQQQVWLDLDDVLIHGSWAKADGTEMGVLAAGVDSGGHHTQQVYKYCKKRQKKYRIFAIKGVGGEGKAITSSPARKRYGKNKLPVELFSLGVDEIKRIIFRRLESEEVGPGYIHFPKTQEFTDEYFKQLTAEKQKIKFTRGVPKRYWVQTRARNETLDCMVYAYGAMTLLQANWEALEKRQDLQKEKGNDTTPEPENQSTKQPNKRPRGRRRPGRRGWMDGIG